MIAPAASSLHLPTNINPKESAAIAANSTLSAVPIIISINFSYKSYLPDPAYANPKPITAPIFT